MFRSFSLLFSLLLLVGCSGTQEGLEVSSQPSVVPITTEASPATSADGQIDCTNRADLDYSGMNLSGCKFEDLPGDSTFSGANLAGATFTGSLLGVDFSNANLRGASFIKADLSESNFDNADLRESYFMDTIVLTKATFIDADLSGSIWRATTELSGVDLTRANLTGVKLYNSSIDFNQVKILCGTIRGDGTVDNRDC